MSNILNQRVCLNDPIANLVKKFKFEGGPLILGPHYLQFEGFQLVGDVALGIHQGLLAHIMDRDIG